MRAGLCAIAGFALGCAALPLGLPRIPACPGPLVDVAAIPGGDFRLRERARVESGDVALSLELVAERRGERLVVLAIDPFGARVFSTVQERSELESDSRLGRALAIDPPTLLADLHAARFGPTADATERVEVSRPGCAHRTALTRVERRPLR